jgi:hypothetical protein
MKFLIYILFFVFTLNAHAQDNGVDNLKNDFKKAIVSNNLDDQNNMANQLKSFYSSKQYLYYSILLKNTPNNSILVTNGLDDTYPLRILQLTQSLKKDVKIVSLELLVDNDYRNLISSQYNFKLIGFNKAENLKHILNQSKVNVCISTTVNYKDYTNNGSSLYNHGLYISSNGDTQTSQLNLFWNQVNNINWKNQTLSSSEKQLYQNYLPPLLTLYKLQLDSVNKDKLLRVINYVAEKVDKSEIVNKILETYKN